MPEQTTTFTKALRRFEEMNVRFVVIGGVAMGLYGSDYLTEDVDIVYSAEPENVARLATLLTALNPRLLGRSERLVVTAELLQKARFLNLSTDMGAMDVMREVPGIDSFEGVWERSIQMEVEGVVIRVASLDDLIAMKKAVNRPKDQTHLFELFALKKLRNTESEAE